VFEDIAPLTEAYSVKLLPIDPWEVALDALLLSASELVISSSNLDRRRLLALTVGGVYRTRELKRQVFDRLTFLPV
jgi:hypothetical protein